MAQAIFRFFAELNHFLAPPHQGVSFTHHFQDKTSVKDRIESLGVPHPEVHKITVNGTEVDFAYFVQNGDKINVYPLSHDPTLTIPLIPPPPSPIRFILDVHLGKLASDLRLLGFDTLYQNDYDDQELAEISSQEQRILLSRDRGVLMRSIVTYGYYVRSTSPRKQLLEILQRFNLFNNIQPFARCIRCNGLINSVEKALIIDQLPPLVKADINEFHQCTSCEQIYWRGTHYLKMLEFLEKVQTQSF